MSKPKCVVCGKDRKSSASRSTTVEQLTEAELDRLLEKRSKGDYAHSACATDLRQAIGIANSDDQLIEWTEAGGCMPVGYVEQAD